MKKCKNCQFLNDNDSHHCQVCEKPLEIDKPNFSEEKLQVKIENVDYMNQIHLEIIKELSKAEKKHSWDNTGLIKQGLILAEESGEVAQAILDYDVSTSESALEHLKVELRQTAAMCLRILKNLPK